MTRARIAPARTAAAVSTVLLVLVTGAWLQPARASAPDAPDFPALLRAEADRLPLVTSDEAALSLFRARLLKSLDLEPSLTSPEERQAANRPTAEPRELTDAAVKLVADLAAWRLALRVGSTGESPAPGLSAEAAQQDAPHRAWLLGKGDRPALRRALAAADGQSAPATEARAGDGTAAVQAQLEAERDTLLSWIRLRGASDRAKTLQGLGRLCGSWLWTIHNHQNHQDHKSQIVFPPPDAAAPAGSGPSKILIVGDAIYLRWEFRGGFQEDSLLFAGGGQRVEGTFVHSAGAWGSITGKRTAACGKASDGPPAAGR